MGCVTCGKRFVSPRSVVQSQPSVSTSSTRRRFKAGRKKQTVVTGPNAIIQPEASEPVSSETSTTDESQE